MRLTLRTSLVAAIGLMTVAALLQGFFSLHQLGILRNDLVHAERKWTPSIDRLQQIGFDLVQLRARQARHILAKSTEEMAGIEKLIDKVVGELDEDRKGYEALEREEASRAEYDRAMRSYGELMTHHPKMIALSRSGDKDGAHALLTGPVKIASDGALDPIRRAVEATRKAAATEFDHADESYGTLRISALVSMLIILSIGGGVVAFAIYGISRPISAVAEATTAIAEGRLDAEVPHAARSDEIGVLAQRLLSFRNKLQENERLRQAAEKDEMLLRTSRNSQFEMLKSGAEMLGSFNELSLDMTQLEHNTGQVKSNSGTIASASAEMVASVEEIARTSEQAAEDAGSANGAVRMGLEAVSTVTEAMTNIAVSVDQTASSVDELGQAASQIGQILATIENIASQTNLLALNATIEAARAGEAGRGFAIVANEVKQLAGQTSKATEDISHRIEALRGGMGAILGAMQRSKSAVDQGQHSIREAGQTIETIASQVNGVAGKMGEISSVLNQQKAASHEISEAINSVATTASNNEHLLISMADKLAESNDLFAKQSSGWHKEGDARSLCEVAKIDHITFKKRVVDTLMRRQRWAACDVPDHHQCRLGKWYDTIADAQIKQLPAYRALEAPHAEVHALAKKVLSAFECSETTEALTHLDAMSNASRRVVSSLDELSQAIGQLEAPARKAG